MVDVLVNEQMDELGVGAKSMTVVFLSELGEALS